MSARVHLNIPSDIPLRNVIPIKLNHVNKEYVVIFVKQKCNQPSALIKRKSDSLNKKKLPCLCIRGYVSISLSISFYMFETQLITDLCIMNRKSDSCRIFQTH